MGRAVVILLLISALLFGGLLGAIERAAFLKAERDAVQAELNQVHAAAEQDRVRYAIQLERMVTLDTQIKELRDYAATIPEGADSCLSAADTDRLRGLWD